MLTVNRESAIQGFGIPRIRGNLKSRGYKEAQTEFWCTIIGAVIGAAIGAAVGESGG